MTGQLEKHALRESIKKNVPKRFRDVVFGGVTSTTTFDQLWDAIRMHFGEIELIARREYERGYEDGKSGRKPREYLDTSP